AAPPKQGSWSSRSLPSMFRAGRTLRDGHDGRVTPSRAAAASLGGGHRRFVACASRGRRPAGTVPPSTTHGAHTMFTAILLGAPTWVWPLLAALIALGVSQAFPRTMTLRRATIVPVALIVFSLSGVATTFRGQGIAIVAWALSVAVAAWLAA